MRLEQLAWLPEPDRAPLLDFWIAAWAPVIPSIDFAADRGWLSDHLDGLLREGAVLLLARDEAGRPRGFLTLDRATGTVDQLAVDPACGGQGVGRRLMDEAKRLAATGLTLRVNQINVRAVHFYRQAGFAVTGEAVSARSGLPVFTMAWPGGGP